MLIFNPKAPEAFLYLQFFSESELKYLPYFLIGIKTNCTFIIKIIKYYLNPSINFSITISGTMRYNMFVNVIQDEVHNITGILAKSV